MLEALPHAPVRIQCRSDRSPYEVEDRSRPVAALGVAAFAIICRRLDERAAGDRAGRSRGAAPAGEWRAYGADNANTRYSALDQINAENFGKLEVAWRFKTDALGPRPEFNLQATPLMVGGRLFATAGTRRAAVALDAGTGELLWMHSLNEGKRGEAAPRQLSGRGLAYWTDGNEERIFYVTPGYQLIALNAKTGVRSGLRPERHRRSEAGHRSEDGSVRGRNRAARDAGRRRDVVIVGAAHLPGGSPRGRKNVRATSAASTCAPASACGFSTRSPGLASSATTRG